MKLFHVKFASCFKATPTAPRFWKHSFESCYIFPANVPAGQDGADSVSEATAKVSPSTPSASMPNWAANSISHAQPQPRSSEGGVPFAFYLDARFDTAVCSWNSLGWRLVVTIAQFGHWAQDTNPSLQHWRERWGESALASFANVTLPTGKTMNKAKNGDFWRFWLLGVLKDGKYGLSIGDIHQALNEGAGTAYAPELAFKHWKPNNFLSTSDFTHAEVVSAFDLPINATALGYYINDPQDLAQEPGKFSNYISSVKKVAPPELPIIVWETGGSTFNLTLAEQAEWAGLMLSKVQSHGLRGFNWWQWVDWAPYPSSPCNPSVSVTQCDLFHFGAHFLNGTAKPVWKVLVGGGAPEIGHDL